MKSLTLIAFTILFGTAFCQDNYLSLDIHYFDTLSTDNYHYEPRGYVLFGDSTSYHAELLSNDSIPQVLYTYSCDLQPGSFSNEGFNYDATQSVFTHSIGNYPQPGLLLHVWLFRNGVIYNELYFKH